jgi:hypothetical protein
MDFGRILTALRRHPLLADVTLAAALAALAVTTLQFTGYWAVGQVNEIASWVILGVAVYSAAANADRRPARWVCGACLLWLIGSAVVLSARADSIGAVEAAAIVIFDALPFLLAWPLGTMMRRLREYRIIQEALTNTLKHAGPAHAGVTVRYGDASVEVEVVDDGQGPPPGRPRTGSKGLVGMRERVSLYGGRLDAGPRPDGGFRVHAVLRSGGS